MNTVFIIKRDVDQNGKPLKTDPDGNPYYAYWAGKNGGGWYFRCGAAEYATRKHAEQAIKRNAKSDWTFHRGNAYIVEIDCTAERG